MIFYRLFFLLQDECSFVSLRDVERVLEVMSWFYRQSEDDTMLFQKMKEDSEDSQTETDDESMEIFPPHQASLFRNESLKDKYTPVVNNIHMIVWFGLVWSMMFNATFNNISVISWRSVLLVMETAVS
jgi:hypothetical protein